LIIDVRINTNQAVAFLQLGGNRLKYGLANAVNSTMKQAQRDVVAHARRTMTIRKSEFTTRQLAIIKPFASAPQGRYYATMAVGQRPRLLLTALEAGGPRPSATPGKAAAVAITGEIARPTFQTAQTFPALIQRLGLKRRTPVAGRRPRRPRRRKARLTEQEILIGAQRTFETKKGVFRRESPSAVHAVYLFIRGAQLPATLHFMDTARATIARRWPAEIDSEIRKAFEFQSRKGAG
jgi:hypothetical protein